MPKKPDDFYQKKFLAPFTQPAAKSLVLDALGRLSSGHTKRPIAGKS